MAVRKIKEVRVGKCAVKIYRDPDFNEYRVATVIRGKLAGGKDGGVYFTDDKGDARSTAAAIVRKIRRYAACRG